MIEKKYELVEEQKYTGNLYRPRACKDFQLITGEIVKKGDLGGLVEGAHNLSQQGKCWIEYEAKAFDFSRILENALLKDSSLATDNSRILGNAIMEGYSKACDFSIITGNAVLKDGAEACENCIITGNTRLQDRASAGNHAVVEGYAVMKDWAFAGGSSRILGNAVIKEYQQILHGAVTTDLLGTKDWIGALYAELGIVPQNNKVKLYKMLHLYGNNFWVKNGNDSFGGELKYISKIFEACRFETWFTSEEYATQHFGTNIAEFEIDVSDIVNVQNARVTTRNYKFIRIIQS